MRTVLVTGGSGFIGRRLVRLLLDEGVAVRTTVHAAAPPAARAGERLESLRGSLTDAAFVGRALAGVDTVFHLAACAKAWARDPAVFTEANVRATGTLLSAFEPAGAGRFVHVSSVLTLPPFRPAPVNGPSREPTPYEATKTAGDALVRAFVARGGDAVILRPTRVYGPGPLNDANGVTQVVDLYLRGRFRFRIDDGDMLANYVHVDDVARGILLAARHAPPGGEYLLGGEDASMRRFLEIVAAVSGVRRRVVAIPPRAALAAARAAVLGGRAGFTPSLTPGWVRIFLEDRRVDVSPARRDLGYEPRGLEQGLAETLAWLRARGKEASS